MPKFADIITHLNAALSALTETVDWWNPSPADQLKFCAEYGFPPEYADGWPGAPTPNEPNTWQGKIAPLPLDASDDLLKRYHGMGFSRDGRRKSWTALMLSQARSKCDQLKIATTPEEQDAIAGEGARNLPTETVRVLLLGQGDGSPAYYGPLVQYPTIANAANYCVGIPVSSASGEPTTPAQPGPGVG